MPEGGHGNPLQYSCLETPHGQRSLAGYSPWGHKESDRAERPSTSQQAQLLQNYHSSLNRAHTAQTTNNWTAQMGDHGGLNYDKNTKRETNIDCYS